MLKDLTNQIDKLEQEFCTKLHNYLTEIGEDGSLTSVYGLDGEGTLTLRICIPGLRVQNFVPKKGRQSNNLQQAYAAISHNPIRLSELCKKYNVSYNSIRQYKRFDKTGLTGRILFKVVGEDTYVFREPLSHTMFREQFGEDGLSKTLAELNHAS